MIFWGVQAWAGCRPRSGSFESDDSTGRGGLHGWHFADVTGTPFEIQVAEHKPSHDVYMYAYITYLVILSYIYTHTLISLCM